MVFVSCGGEVRRENIANAAVAAKSIILIMVNKI
jgi:hypothetical protein